MIEQVEAPPPLRRPNKAARYQEEVDWMRQNPGKWTVIRDTSQAVGNQIRRGDYSAFRPTTDWEITQRVRDDNPKRYDIYIRYINLAALTGAVPADEHTQAPPPPPIGPPPLPSGAPPLMARDVIPELQGGTQADADAVFSD